MRVGVLDILALPTRRPFQIAYRQVITRQFASVTPQAIAAWCRRRGHETFYSTYWGGGDPRRLLPSDLDVLFVAAYTQASALAYAIGVLYRRMGTRTVIGGPHARAFPVDCRRFFDLVVDDCDEELVVDILADRFAPGSVISSARPLRDVPTVEERMPEIRASAFLFGRRTRLSTVPMLASMGCPYACDFCVDWSAPYRELDLDRVTADLRYIARRLPGSLVMFHDPNFAVGFERMFAALESLPEPDRPPYMMESSLTVLRSDRLPRLRDTNCVLVAPGIESWTDYSAKAAVGRRAGTEKVDLVAEHFRRIAEHVPYVQANFMFGLDTDLGDEPIDLTTEFMDRTPFVWPAINIPVPFGGTPMYEALLSNGRVLRAMPFSFYYAPFLVTTLKHYAPIEYYERLIALFAHLASPEMLRRRIASTESRLIRFIHRVRTAGVRSQIESLRRVQRALVADPGLRAFHGGSSAALPEYYHHLFDRMLGPFAGILTRADRSPVLERVEPVRA